jgi:hypothetical protein
MVTSIVIGGLAAYYFGTRIGAYVAGATMLAVLLGFFLPRYAFVVNLCIAAGGLVIWRVGSQRPVPPQSVLAVRWVRATATRLIARVRSR